MYILQLADLHIGSEKKTSKSERNLIKDSIIEIKKKVLENEELLISVCGDIIDSATLSADDTNEVETRYREAASLFEIYKQNFESRNRLHIKFCPGNHDITHINEFVSFVKQIDENILSMDDILNGNYYYSEQERTYFIFINSCHQSQYKKGKIDFSNLEKICEKIGSDENKILILHHTIMSMDDKDDSSIMNASKLISYIDKYNIIAIMHGHVHARDIIQLGYRKSKIIGTGALFSRSYNDVNSQFNIIKCVRGTLLNVDNYRYNADSINGGTSWTCEDLNYRELSNYFFADNFKAVYDALQDRLEAQKILYNTTLHINNDYDKFIQQLHEQLDNDFQQFGTRRLNYFELAEMWERDVVPEDLYFNHGSYFRVEDNYGLDLLEKQMQKKPTGNGNVLITYSMHDMLNYVKGVNDTVPSLLSIQFSLGEDRTTLFIHMHLRALEAKRFLKINICEIVYLLEKLKKDTIVNFKKIDITISAFRVQQRDKFNCFVKTELDIMKPEELGMIIYSEEIDALCSLLEEKKNAYETVTKIEKLESLRSSMLITNKRKNKELYGKHITNLIKKIQKTYGELDEIQKKSSISAKEEQMYMNEIVSLMDQLINQLKHIKEINVQ